MINFPDSGKVFLFGRQTVYPSASCSDSGTTPTTVILAAGEGRQFKNAQYPSGYGTKRSCTYNFEPAAGAQLRFSCDDFDLTATSAAGALCTGDYLRFYDENGSLGSSGTRYCFTTAPAFTYSTNIKVLFKTNNDANTGKGFDCQVVSEAITTTTTTTTTTTPSASSCVTIDGPGAGKACKDVFRYGYQRAQYSGCINQETPGQYLVTVPDFGDPRPVPRHRP